MALFVVIGLDDEPESFERRNALRTEHLRFVETIEDSIRMVGPTFNKDNVINGSIYLMEAEDEAVVRARFETEPYYRGGVYRDFLVRPFEVRKCDMPLKARPKPA